MISEQASGSALPSTPSSGKDAVRLTDDEVRTLWRQVNGPKSELTGPLIRFAGLAFDKALERLHVVLADLSRLARDEQAWCSNSACGCDYSRAVAAAESVLSASPVLTTAEGEQKDRTR